MQGSENNTFISNNNILTLISEEKCNYYTDKALVCISWKLYKCYCDVIDNVI